jgi:hypothetical protein
VLAGRDDPEFELPRMTDEDLMVLLGRVVLGV